MGLGGARARLCRHRHRRRARPGGRQPEGHGRDGRRPLVSCQVRRRGRRHADRHGDRAGHGPRPRPAVGQGDWDLGVFDFSSGRTIAGSAGFASNELAEGFVKKGQKLRVQACRFRGSASSAELSVGFVAIAERASGKVQVVDVDTATRKDKQRAAGPRPRPHRARRRQLRRGRPARHGRRAHAARRRLHLRRPDLRSRGALEGEHERRREVRGVEPQDPAAQRQQRLPASRRLQPRAQAARHALSGARQGADAQQPDGRGPRRQRHRDHDEPQRARRQGDLPPARRPPRA